MDEVGEVFAFLYDPSSTPEAPLIDSSTGEQ